MLVAGCSFQHGELLATHDDASSDDSSSVSSDAMIDALVEAPIDAAPDARVCPPMAGCTAFQCASTTSCYYYCTTKTSWQTAQNTCDDQPSGCLVTINDQMEQDCVVANVMPMFVNFPWIGFRQAPNGAEPAGGWSFQCGTSAYAHPTWGMAEPNNIGNEDCAAMTDGGGWFDSGCNENGRYVCEVP
jgi:hypothetical protein